MQIETSEVHTKNLRIISRKILSKEKENYFYHSNEKKSIFSLILRKLESLSVCLESL